MDEVELVYADAERIVRACVPWREGLCVSDALQCAPEFATFDLSALGVAVWGERVVADHVLRPGDRLELVPPLPNDPKDARRQRARDARALRRKK